jgi:hypothetical protein
LSFINVEDLVLVELICATTTRSGTISKIISRFYST